MHEGAFLLQRLERAKTKVRQTPTLFRTPSPAHIAAATPLKPFPEVLEQHPPPTPPSLDVTPHLRRQIAPGEVRSPPQDPTLRRFAVAPGASRLLVVRLERAGWTPVDHPPHVGFVDPHAERRRRDDGADAVAEKRSQDARTNG